MNIAIIVAIVLFVAACLHWWLGRNGHWEPARCGWPYPNGYCCLNRRKNTSMDHGVTLERARELCAELNAK